MLSQVLTQKVSHLCDMPPCRAYLSG